MTNGQNNRDRLDRIEAIVEATSAKELFKNKFGLFELIIESPPLSVGLLRPNLFLNRP